MKTYKDPTTPSAKQYLKQWKKQPLTQTYSNSFSRSEPPKRDLKDGPLQNQYLMTKQLHDSIKEQGLDLNEYFFLYSAANTLGLEIPLTHESFRKLEKLNLYRNYELTDSGRSFVSPKGEQPKLDSFDRFYDTFPVDDAWLPFFEKSRPVRAKRSEVKVAYQEATRSISEADLLKATERYVASFQPTSSMLTHSPYKYIKGPLNYLREKVYEKWV